MVKVRTNHDRQAAEVGIVMQRVIFRFRSGDRGLRMYHGEVV